MPPKKKYNKNSPFLETLTNAELSPITKNVYLERWKNIMINHKVDIYTILTKPTIYIKWIIDNYDSPQTRKSYISAVLAMFRHNEGLKEQEKKAYNEWYEAFKDINKVIEDRYRRNEPTEKQEAGYVEYSEIVKKRDTLTKGTFEKLLLSFYTYIPPLRCDLNELHIYDKSKTKESSMTAKNYIILDKENKSAIMILNEFKTAKHLKEYRKELPVELVEELIASIDKHPRNFAFVDRDNNPYRPSAFRKWANRILARLFEKPLTISLIRHSFINSLDFNKLTIEEKESIAKDMAHTTQMQDRYRLIFNKN